MGGVAVVAAGRGAPMAPAYDDRPDALVPADGPLAADDLRTGALLAGLPRLPDVGGRRAARPAGRSWSEPGHRPTSRQGESPTRPVGPRRRGDDHAARHTAAPCRSRVIVYVLTALAAVVVVLTRLRLSGSAAGRPASMSAAGCSTCTRSPACSPSSWLDRVPRPGRLLLGGPLRRHRRAGPLVDHRHRGLLILVRWLPSQGKHAPEAVRDTLVATGPGLSVLAHVGMLVGVIVFTCAYLTARRAEPAPPGPSRTPPCWPRGPRRGARPLAPAPAVAAAARPRPPTAAPSSSRRSIGHSVARPADPSPGTSASRASRKVRADRRRCTATSRTPRRILDDPARRAADPRRRPVGGPDLQPRRPAPGHPPQRPRRRPEPQLPPPLGRPRRQLRVRPPPGVRARDPGDDGVPERDRPAPT